MTTTQTPATPAFEVGNYSCPAAARNGTHDIVPCPECVPTTTPEPLAQPTFNNYDGIWALVNSPYDDEWGNGVLVTIWGSDSISGHYANGTEDGWNETTERYEDWIVDECEFQVSFVGGPRYGRHGKDRVQSTYPSDGYGNVPVSMLRRPTRGEISDQFGRTDRDLEAAEDRLRRALDAVDEIKKLWDTLDSLYEATPED